MQRADVFSEFNKSAGRFAVISSLLQEQGPLLEWGQGEAVLDAGCGPGDVTAEVLLPWLPANCRVVLGVDVSPAVIQHALIHHASGHHNLTFSVADIGGDPSQILQIDSCESGFDKIFSFYVMHWLPDIEKGIENIYDLLRPGGQSLLVFPVDRLFQKTYKKVGACNTWSRYFKNIKSKLPSFPKEDPNKEFQEMLLQAGFEIIKCEVEDFTKVFESADVLKGMIESLNPDIGCVPQDLKPQYLEECAETLQDMGVVRANLPGVSLTQKMLTTVIRKPRS